LIALFTDFGFDGPYVGQVKAVLAREAPGMAVIDLQHDAPVHDPRASAYLLATLLTELPESVVVLAVVDPGVGTERRGAIVRVDGRWLVGPDNGLFNVLLARAGHAEWWDVAWTPERLSSTFHGRDLFAPVAARIAMGESPSGEPVPASERLRPGWPDDLMEVVYIDRFGNAMTGLRAGSVDDAARFRCEKSEFAHARTFGAVDEGQPFWYTNSIGLVELAMNRRHAAAEHGLRVGSPVERLCA